MFGPIDAAMNLQSKRGWGETFEKFKLVSSFFRFNATTRRYGKMRAFNRTSKVLFVCQHVQGTAAVMMVSHILAVQEIKFEDEFIKKGGII